MTKRIIAGLALAAILFLALWGGGLWFAVPCMITTCLSFHEMIEATVHSVAFTICKEYYGKSREQRPYLWPHL